MSTGDWDQLIWSTKKQKRDALKQVSICPSITLSLEWQHLCTVLLPSGRLRPAAVKRFGAQLLPGGGFGRRGGERESGRTIR
eukprot:SAG11_NODE_3071_length_2713_cov_16.731446_4_plen_82_part_00